MATDEREPVLVLVLGDQLQPNHPLLADADPARTRILMAEVPAEVGRHPNHRSRVLLFLGAMRAFARARRDEGWDVTYQRIGDAEHADLPAFVRACVRDDGAAVVRVLEPGRFDLETELRDACHSEGAELEVVANPHFLCDTATFRDWADGRKSMLMETFYRFQRKRLGVLMEGTKPRGGTWNYDADNRESFGKEGPGLLRPPERFDNDEVLAPLRDELDAAAGAHGFTLTGSCDAFDWPLTPAQAQRALDDFITYRLPKFGDYQDAMWTGQPWLYHSRLSAALNLQLLDPRDVVVAAVDALDRGDAPINAVEGFVRQIIGWREFIRGVYAVDMPALLDRNALDADRPLPALFWNAETDMRCLREVVSQLLETAYAHHIQRLMVAGLFAQLAGIRPRDVHDWFMALYVDSVEWVTLPNVVGMSQYADGGIVGTKPYVATGKYVKRQSNYCDHCRFDSGKATGDDACPFTTLYWHFLDRHRERFANHHRMALQIRNVERKSEDDLQQIRAQAARVFKALDEGTL